MYIEHINAIIEHIHEETTDLYEAMADREFDKSASILEGLITFLNEVKEDFNPENL